MLCHDPRISNDRLHVVETDNLILKIVETLRQGGLPASEVDWEDVVCMADGCDLSDRCVRSE
jgi:hypothetical protein